ncbi:MAG: hypothetical protein GY810_13720 [Aureispira sp.]|nr:hypothetical protein [Aureispira sp.]
MLRFLCCITLSVICVGLLDAQLDKVHELAYEPGFRLKLELYAQGGISIPLGKYGMLSEESSPKGAAKFGGYGEVIATHRLRKTPLWGVQAVLGYMQHDFKQEQIKTTYDLLLFDAKPWQILYLMPGIEFQGGRKFKFAVGLSAGALLYSGWNASSGNYNKGLMEHREWGFGWKVAGGLRTNLMLGYRVAKRWFVYIQTAWLYGGGARSGILTKGMYRFDLLTGNKQGESLSSETLTVLHSTVVHTVNIGIGARYRFYRFLHDPNAGLDGAIRVY